MGDSDKSIFSALFSLSAISTTAAAISAGSSASNYSSYESTRNANTKQCNNAFVDADQLVAQIGDLIEFDYDYFYHWGILIVPGVVIHFVKLKDGTGNGKVIQQSVTEAAAGNKCRVNNLELAARGHGLVRKAGRLVASTAYTFLDETYAYDAVDQNCEHFVTQCAYDKAFSQQENNVKGKPFVLLAAKLGAGNSARNQSTFRSD